MNQSRIKPNLLRLAGLVVGPAAWAVNTQLSQILSASDCGAPIPLLAVTSILSTAVSLGSAYLSWHGLSLATESVSATLPRTDRFIGHLGALTGFLFGFALILQCSASLILPPCEL